MPARRLPSPNLLRRCVGLFGAAAAWAAQMSVGNSVASYACFPHQTPLPAPLWDNTKTGLLAFGILCLAAGIFSGSVALAAWKDARRGREGGGPEIFLAALGLMSSGLFLTAMFFASGATILVSLCQPWGWP